MTRRLLFLVAAAWAGLAPAATCAATDAETARAAFKDLLTPIPHYKFGDSREPLMAVGVVSQTHCPPGFLLLGF